MSRTKSVQELDIPIPATRRGGCYPCFLTIVLALIAVFVMVFPLLNNLPDNYDQTYYHFKGTLLGWLSMIGVMIAILSVIIIDQVARRQNLKCCNCAGTFVGILFIPVVVFGILYFIPHAHLVISTLTEIIPDDAGEISGTTLNTKVSMDIMKFVYKLSCNNLELVSEIEKPKDIACKNGFNVVFNWFMKCGDKLCENAEELGVKPSAGYFAVVYIVSYVFMLLILVVLIASFISCYKKPKDRIITMRVKCVGDDFKTEVVKKSRK